MRSLGTGSFTFGLVNVPVKAYGATEDHDVSLHQVHDADGGRIRYQRRCEKRSGTTTAKPAPCTKAAPATKKAARHPTTGTSGPKARNAAALKSTVSKNAAKSGRTVPRLGRGA